MQVGSATHSFPSFHSSCGCVRYLSILSPTLFDEWKCCATLPPQSQRKQSSIVEEPLFINYSTAQFFLSIKPAHCPAILSLFLVFFSAFMVFPFAVFEFYAFPSFLATRAHTLKTYTFQLHLQNRTHSNHLKPPFFEASFTEKKERNKNKHHKIHSASQQIKKKHQQCSSSTELCVVGW